MVVTEEHVRPSVQLVQARRRSPERKGIAAGTALWGMIIECQEYSWRLSFVNRQVVKAFKKAKGPVAGQTGRWWSKAAWSTAVKGRSKVLRGGGRWSTVAEVIDNF